MGQLDDIEAVLEIGAGEGAFGVRLASVYDYAGVEPDRAAAAKAQARLLKLGRGAVVGGLDGLDPGQRFDVVCAFEVLEHIADEHEVLTAWGQRLRPRGWLLLSVPAGECRYGAADRRVGHYRRYEPERLAQVLGEAEFVVRHVKRVGLLLGYSLETLRHLIATFGRAEASREARSAASGRWLQPPESLGWATRGFTAPFRALEARLPPNRLGTNLIVLAQLAHQPGESSETA
ncbi:MAG: class I SAM-dependent methyltransferase [Gaiellaceae bacterium]